MIGLTDVREFCVPRIIVARSMEFLAAVGKTHNEALVLWVGTLDGASAKVADVVVPRQMPLQTRSGIGVYVGSDTLHELSVWLHQHGLRLLAQMHSHGEDAYHSDTDDHHSIITTRGGISIVVPHFARGSFGFGHCSVHRLQLDGWHDLTENEARELIRIHEKE